jgi:hypothetical protein
MRVYDYEKINALIQPLMEMMRIEFPNDCKLVIGTDFAEIIWEHTDMMFQRNGIDMGDMETPIAKEFQNFMNNLKNLGARTVETAETTTADTADTE